jgi:hypothetical protein
MVVDSMAFVDARVAATKAEAQRVNSILVGSQRLPQNPTRIYMRLVDLTILLVRVGRTKRQFTDLSEYRVVVVVIQGDSPSANAALRTPVWAASQAGRSAQISR